MKLHPDARPTQGADGAWLALSAAGVPLCILDGAANVVWNNAAFAELFTTDPADVLGARLADVVGPEANAVLGRAVEQIQRGTDILRRLEVAIHERDESRVDLTVSISRTTLWDGQERTMLVVEDRTHLVQPLRNLVERKFEMARRASEGSLSGLPSRSTLEFLLASSLRRATERHIPFALLFCQLEGLAELSAAHGPGVAEEMRWIAAARMNRVLRLHDTLAHLGGNEFVVIAEEVGNLDVGRLIANRLINAVGDSLRVGDAAAHLDLTVGVLLPTGNESVYRLLAPGPRDEIIRSSEVITVA